MTNRPHIHGVIAITDPRLPSPETFLPTCIHLIQNIRPHWLHLRAKDLPHTQRKTLAQTLQHACITTRTRLLINTDIDIAYDVRADGIHLPSNTPYEMIHDIRTSAPWMSVSRACHSLDDLSCAASHTYDAVTLSPIASPLSKPSDARPTLGLETLHTACARFPSLPIIALGGITPTLAPMCRRAGAQGVAAISAFFQDQNLIAAQQLMRAWNDTA